MKSKSTKAKANTRSKAKDNFKEATSDNYAIRVYDADNEANEFWNATLTICEMFAVKIIIRDGKNGFFACLPSYKNGEGEYINTVFPITKEARKELDDLVNSVMEDEEA